MYWATEYHVGFVSPLLYNLIQLEFVSSGTAGLPYRVPSEPFAAILQLLQTMIISRGYQVLDFKRGRKPYNQNPLAHLAASLERHPMC